MINCVIIDDEPMARKLLLDYCHKIPELSVISNFSDGMKAMEFLQSNRVDLIFLDIKMPQVSGLDLLKVIRPNSCVVLTTAFAEYAVDGFELDAVDYLLKPFAFSRFLKAIDKVKKTIEGSKKSSIEKTPDFMFVKEGRELVKILFEDLLYIKGTGDYVTFYLKGRSIMSLMKMKELERDLPGNAFFRIHQSYIVNTKWILRISNDKVEVPNKFLPISRSYKQAFKSFIRADG